MLTEDLFLAGCCWGGRQGGWFCTTFSKEGCDTSNTERRTADEQAREEKFYRDLSHPNTFAALVDDSASHLEDELRQGPLAEADNMEEPGQDFDRLVPLSRLNAY